MTPNMEQFFQVKELDHANVNIFVGACIEEPLIYILTGYCNKGSLQDLLENESIKLDWIYKFSFIYDIANVSFNSISCM